MHESNPSSNLLLEAKVGGLLVPEGEGGWYSIHGLDAMHDPGGDSCGEVGDQGGSIFYLIVFGTDDVQLERIDIFLELFPSINVSGG